MSVTLPGNVFKATCMASPLVRLAPGAFWSRPSMEAFSSSALAMPAQPGIRITAEQIARTRNVCTTRLALVVVIFSLLSEACADLGLHFCCGFEVCLRNRIVAVLGDRPNP